jgi:hypothetical protein
VSPFGVTKIVATLFSRAQFGMQAPPVTSDVHVTAGFPSQLASSVVPNCIYPYNDIRAPAARGLR